MTLAATGPATLPPVAPSSVSALPSSTTASAISGLSMSDPAKPTNQVVGPLSEPVSAVPVLPATLTPETWALVPVPSATASCMREDRDLAVLESMGVRATFLEVVLTSLRSG